MVQAYEEMCDLSMQTNTVITAQTTAGNKSLYNKLPRSTECAATFDGSLKSDFRHKF